MTPDPQPTPPVPVASAEPPGQYDSGRNHLETPREQANHINPQPSMSTSTEPKYEHEETERLLADANVVSYPNTIKRNVRLRAQPFRPAPWREGGREAGRHLGATELTLL
jgi:hypothetical protein